MEKKMRLLLVVGAFITGAFIFGAILLILIYLLRRLFHEAKGAENKPREERLTSVKISSGNEHACKESVKAADCTIRVDKVSDNGQASWESPASTDGKEHQVLSQTMEKWKKQKFWFMKKKKSLPSIPHCKAADDFAFGDNKFNAADDFDPDPNTASSDSD